MLKYKIPQIVTLTHKIPQIVTLTPNQQFFIAPNCIFLRTVHKEKTAEITVFQRFS